jgi:hypothetical protein
MGRNSLRAGAVPRSSGGALRVVTNVERGMRWTLRRARRARLQADGEAVWSWHLDADAKSAGYPLMMVTNKPDHQGERGGNRKTIVQGMPECFGLPVVTTLVCFHSSHTRLRVRPSTRHSLRPRLEGGTFKAKLAPSTRRDRETVSRRHCEERKRRSNPLFRSPLLDCAPRARGVDAPITSARIGWAPRRSSSVAASDVRSNSGRPRPLR